MKNPIYSLLITFPKQGNKNPFLLDFYFFFFPTYFSVFVSFSPQSLILPNSANNY